MSIPEGYQVAPTYTDHLLKIAVPVTGRDPILIEAPRQAWVPPNEVDVYQEWLKPYNEAEESLLAWHVANDDLPEDERAPFPDKEKDLLTSVTMREIQLRWLKPYMSAAEYKLLISSKKIPERTIQWVIGQFKGEDISGGESSASADS